MMFKAERRTRGSRERDGERSMCSDVCEGCTTVVAEAICAEMSATGIAVALQGCVRETGVCVREEDEWKAV